MLPIIQVFSILDKYIISRENIPFYLQYLINYCNIICMYNSSTTSPFFLINKSSINITHTVLQKDVSLQGLVKTCKRESIPFVSFSFYFKYIDFTYLHIISVRG